MAARESQGLQIALIIFVGLTLILGVLTFVYFRNYEAEFAKAVKNEAARLAAEKNLQANIEDFNEVKRLLGVGRDDNKQKIVELHDADMKAHGGALPESEKNYRRLVDVLHVELKTTQGQVADTESREKALQAKIDQDRQEREKEIAKFSEALELVRKDLESEKAKFKVSEGQILAAKDQVAKVADQKGKELDQLTQKSSATETKLKSQYGALEGRYVDLKDKTQTQLETSEVPDGRITWVSQRAKSVYITLGSADGLRRQIVFKVLGEDENNPVKAVKKGSVEVTRVIADHLAEARIIDDELSNPIMIGDKVFSPVWQPGQALRFALAGFIDLDGDGTSDRKRVREIIEQNGGIIDAEVTDEGKRTGAITLNTHYLVLGDDPLDKGTKSEKGNAAAEGYKIIEKEAETRPVKRMAVADFLDLMGYRAEERTIGLGNKATASDFKPRLPDGIQRKSENNMFPPNRETPTAGRKSAY